MGKRSQRKTSWGHRFTPQATVPAVGKGASTAAQSLSLKFTETRSVGGCKKTSPQNTFLQECGYKVMEQPEWIVLCFLPFEEDSTFLQDERADGYWSQALQQTGQGGP